MTALAVGSKGQYAPSRVFPKFESYGPSFRGEADEGGREPSLRTKSRREPTFGTYTADLGQARDRWRPGM